MKILLKSAVYLDPEKLLPHGLVEITIYDEKN